MGCCIGTLGCCFGSAACSLCCTCFSCASSTASRVGYSLILTFSIICSIIMMAPSVAEGIGKYFCKYLDLGGLIPSGKTYTEACKKIAGASAVYRIMFAAECFFLLFTFLMIGVRSSNEIRAKLQNGFWFWKLLILLGTTIGAFFIPQGSFDNAWMYVGLIGAWIFIVAQLILLIDFAYGWSNSWLYKYEESDNKAWCCGLVFFTILLYAASICGVVLLYIYYATGSSCAVPKAIVSVNVILCILVSIVSILPFVREYNEESGIFQSSFVTFYVIFITWSAVASNSDTACNVSLATDGANWISGVSLAVFIITVLYASIRASSHSNVGKLTMGGEEKTTMSDTGGGSDGTGQVYQDEEDCVTYNYSFFHGFMFLGAFYIMMTLTHWLSPNAANSQAMWVKISSSWVCLALYFWSMIAPCVCRDREFS